MVLQLFGARFRQWHLSTESRRQARLRRALPGPRSPSPAKWSCTRRLVGRGVASTCWTFSAKPPRTARYATGSRRGHVSSGSAQTLEDFAASYRMQGEKVVAAETVSKFNDRFFGQWLMLHVPFRSARGSGAAGGGGGPGAGCSQVLRHGPPMQAPDRSGHVAGRRAHSPGVQDERRTPRTTWTP